MSHSATDWAIKQRGLKPAAKIVLWHLCDRYHHDHGCFPSLDTLAEDCEMSRRSVQDQLAELEKSGLITVEKMPRRNGQLPRNRYVLQFENLGQNLPKAKSALGKSTQEPWANSGESLGQNLPPNSVRGTSKGTSNLDAPEKPPRKRNVSLPPDWVPSDRNIADAEARQFSAKEIEDEAAKFRDHHLARGNQFKDWDAAWRTWLGNARKFAAGRMAGNASPGGRGQGGSLASIAARRRFAGEG